MIITIAVIIIATLADLLVINISAVVFLLFCYLLLPNGIGAVLEPCGSLLSRSRSRTRMLLLLR